VVHDCDRALIIKRKLQWVDMKITTRHLRLLAAAVAVAHVRDHTALVTEAMAQQLQPRQVCMGVTSLRLTRLVVRAAAA
jgi:hypothetical protein